MRVNGANNKANERGKMSQSAVTKEQVLEALKKVYDPEIPISVVDLGLVYDVQVNDGNVHMKMTLTAPGCPMSQYIAQQAEWAIAELEDVDDVQVEVVWDPPWSPDRISAEGRKALGLE